MYIGELHKRASPLPTTKEDELALDDEATRLGSRALFYQALVALIANFALPYFVTENQNDLRGNRVTYRRNSRLKKLWQWRPRIHLADMWAFSLLLFACSLGGTL